MIRKDAMKHVPWAQHGIALRNSQQLCLSAEDTHKIEPVSIPSQIGEELGTAPLAEVSRDLIISGWRRVRFMQ